MEPRTRSFEHDGHKLVFDEYVHPGEDQAPAVVLMPGLLFNRNMHRPLASKLARRGYRVYCLDVLGHGDSDRPEEMWEYSMTIFGGQVLGLLDHLELEKAVLGGTSLGANTTLEAAAADQSRVQGMLIEMPVLDNALLGCAIGFTPLLLSLTFGAPVTRALAQAARRVPRRGPFMANLGLDWISQDPKPSASILQGLFFGRVAPPREIRRTLAPPALVIGHGRDPIHPFSDSDMLVKELPDARLVEASSIAELRLSPERLTGEIVAFIDHCWNRSEATPHARAAGRRRTPKGTAPRQARRR